MPHTVTLRPLTPEDAAFLDPWLPTTAAVTQDATTTAAAISTGGLLSRAKRTPTLHLRIIERDTQPVGILIYRLNTPKRGSAIFELIATPPTEARRGAGMTAATLAEEELRAANIHTAYAPAAASHGISMYFWIRLGYAPQLRPNWPCTREGVAWLRRDLQ
jgi:hypothetical protein